MGRVWRTSLVLAPCSLPIPTIFLSSMGPLADLSFSVTFTCGCVACLRLHASPPPAMEAVR